MAIIKLKQSDIEKIVQSVVSENYEMEEDFKEIPDEDEMTEPGPGKEKLKLGYTQDGSPVLYKTNPNGEDELVKMF